MCKICIDSFILIQQYNKQDNGSDIVSVSMLRELLGLQDLGGYAILCHAMLYYAMLCYAILCNGSFRITKKVV